MKDELAEPTGLHGWQEYTPTSSIEKAGSGTSGRHHPSRRLQRVASLCQSALPLFLPLPTHIPWHIFSPYHSFLLTILPTGVSFLRPLKGKSDTIRIKSLLVTSYLRKFVQNRKPQSIRSLTCKVKWSNTSKDYWKYHIRLYKILAQSRYSHKKVTLSPFIPFPSSLSFCQYLGTTCLFPL